MECRTFGANALEQLAFVTGSMQQALEYRSAVVVLKEGKIIAQGFQRIAAGRALAGAGAAQPARAAGVSKTEPQISAPILVRPIAPMGVNTLRLRRS